MLFDLPASREELREAAGAATRRIALDSAATAREPSRARGGRCASSRSRCPIRRSARATATREFAPNCARCSAKGQFGRELLALEPLLDEFDGIEIAAAALQLLERERAARRRAEPRARSDRRAGAAPRTPATDGRGCS